jgi:adrenodoxin-NADP+ reductase
VILAHGALKDRLLGLDGELTASGIVPSRRVVNWYNGSLDNDLDIKKEFDLEKIRDLAVIGNGNIFCDIARTLLKEP